MARFLLSLHVLSDTSETSINLLHTHMFHSLACVCASGGAAQLGRAALCAGPVRVAGLPHAHAFCVSSVCLLFGLLVLARGQTHQCVLCLSAFELFSCFCFLLSLHIHSTNTSVLSHNAET